MVTVNRKFILWSVCLVLILCVGLGLWLFAGSARRGRSTDTAGGGLLADSKASTQGGARERSSSKGDATKQRGTPHSNLEENPLPDDGFLDRQIRDAKNVQATTIRQVLLEGVTLARQPKGFTNTLIRVSPDGRYSAFLSARRFDSCVIVYDSQSGKESVVPAPDEKIMEGRSIRHVAWGGDDGHTLYVVEDATGGARTTEEWGKLKEDQILGQLGQIYQVLYTWPAGQANVQVIDRLQGNVLAIAASSGDELRIVNESKEKGFGHVELRSYRGGKSAGPAKAFELSADGKPLDCLSPQILPVRNELWFATKRWKSDREYQDWLAVVDLSKPELPTRLVAPDVTAFAWTPDEQNVIVDRVGPTDNGGRRGLGFFMMHHDAMDTAVRIGTNGVAQPIAGFSNDGRALYLTGLTKPSVSSPSELLTPGTIQLYKYDLPN